MTESLSLYRALASLKLLEEKPPMWWPEYGTFEVVVGAVLTQNSQWTRVEQSLANLREAGMLSAEAIAEADADRLMALIQPSGLFKNKSKVIKALCSSMLEDFGGFEAFRSDVTREWLLARKGIGPETADSILCYACGRDAMVVDAYTSRLLGAFGFDFETYDAVQDWCSEGLSGHFAPEELPAVYAIFHGMIVEYVKRNKKGRSVDITALLPMV